MFSVLMVTTTFVLLPLQTSKLIELLTTRDPFAGGFRPSARQPHIVIFGHVGLHSIGLFREHLLIKHDSHNVGPPATGAIVVVSPSPPDAQVQQLLTQQASPRWLTWLVGSALSRSDLARAAIDQAVAAYIVGDDRVADGAAVQCFSEAADTRAVLDALSLRYRHPHLPCIVRLSKHAHARQLRLMDVHCVVECAPLTQLLLAVGSCCHGAPTLLHNLLRPLPASDAASAAPSPERVGHDAWHGWHGVSSPQHHGMAGELVAVDSSQRLSQQRVPNELVGMKPLDAVLHAYHATGSVLLARCLAGTGTTDMDQPLAVGGVAFAEPDDLLLSDPTRSQTMQPLLASETPLRADEILLCICEAGQPLLFPAVAVASEAGNLDGHSAAYEPLSQRYEAAPTTTQLITPPDSMVRRSPTGPLLTEVAMPALVDMEMRVQPPSIPEAAQVEMRTQPPSIPEAAQEGAGTSTTWQEWLHGRAQGRPGTSTDHFEPQRLPPPPCLQVVQAGFRVSISRLHTLNGDEQSQVSSPDDLAARVLKASSSELNGAARSDAPLGPPPSPPLAKLRDHVVLCGLPEYPDSLWDFALPLRARARFCDTSECPPIVLLQPTAPSEEASRRAMAQLPGIWFVAGSCGSRHDLLRAGVQYASCIIVTSAANSLPRGTGTVGAGEFGGPNGPRRGVVSSASRVDALYEDATALLTCRELDLWPGLRPRVICQLRHPSNIDFLRPPPEMSISQPSIERSPSVNSGSQGNNSSTPDKAASIKRSVLDRVLGVLSDELQAPHHRAGRVLSPSLMRSLLCRLLDAPRLPALLELMALGGTFGGCLLSWPVPPQLRGKPYCALLEHLVRHANAVPLGLLRTRGKGQQVLTAPAAEDQVYAGDSVFVLAARWMSSVGGAAPPP